MDVIFWIAFIAFIGVFLALDLGVFHKKIETYIQRVSERVLEFANTRG